MKKTQIILKNFLQKIKCKKVKNLFLLKIKLNVKNLSKCKKLFYKNSLIIIFLIFTKSTNNITKLYKYKIIKYLSQKIWTLTCKILKNK